MYTENNHHLYYSRRDMLSYTLSARLRNHEDSQIILPVEIHNDLHANIPAMPVPSAPMARLALEHINTRPRQYRTLDTTRSLIDFMGEGDPTGEHLSLQLPFLILGAEALKRRHL